MTSFAKRLLAAAVLLPLVVAAIALGRATLLILLAGIALVGSGELASLLRRLGVNVRRPVIAGCAGLFLLSRGGVLPIGDSAALLLVTLIAILGQLPRGGGMLLGFPAALAGGVYLGFLPSYALALSTLGEPGGFTPWPVYYGLALVLGCDTGAYGAGKLLGRHSLWRRVSPRKTWEGAVGGLLASVALGWALRGWAPWLSAAEGLAAGFLAGTLGQLGDLAESMMKRDSGQKDSGGLIPGHGGVLDRIDSLLLALPVLYYWLRWTAGGS
ncbi:MAG: hypothetical protein FJY88_10605 [Candidatus Eisenbacteria bacterium]|nr:hypothetical protein [Candidatus Eisenbacteria bacterium]